MKYMSEPMPRGNGKVNNACVEAFSDINESTVQ